MDEHSQLARRFLPIAALYGFTAVALGAFGAHALKASLSPDALNQFETGARYLMYHGLALGLVATARVPGVRAAHISAICFTVGPLIFSGSLFLLALTGQRWLGAITPIGGVFQLAGWVALGLASIIGTRRPR